ncbi:MAG: tail fiber domain-containing protein [Chitinophagaceae bacterium]
MKKKILQFSAAALILLTGFSAKAQIAAPAQYWKITGNTGTNPNVNFLGTTNNFGLAFRTHNIERMRISAAGNVGIGIVTSPSKLSVDAGDYVSLSSPGYQIIGNVKSYNIGMDVDVIQARYNGSAANLFLNYYGGTTYIGNSSSSTYGVFARGSSYAVYGTTSSGTALYGTSSSGDGVYGTSSSLFGVEGHSASASAVYGHSDNYIGVYGTTGNSSSWAGYFNGTVFATTYQTSDQKLKQNIQDVSSALDIINQLHPKKYEYRQDGNYKLMNLPQGQHYGLIAQDVEKVLPNLVKDSKFETKMAQPPSQAQAAVADPRNPDAQSVAASVSSKPNETIDFKALNYTELIPILIKAVQEQQQQINDLKQQVQNLTNAKAVSSSSSVKTITPDMSGASLQQNAPNPFNANTVIRCNVPASAQQAQLSVYSLDGKPLKTFTLNNKGMNEVTINAGALPSGQYIYSLLVDGKKVDSKNMMLTK